MSETNNKLTETQVSNTRLNKFNTQMFEVFKGSKLAEKLEPDHKKNVEEQNKAFNEKETKETNERKNKAETNESKSKKIDRKCW